MSTEEVAGSDGSQEEYHVLVLSADSSERSSVCSSVQSQLPEVSVTSSGSLQECKETLQSRVFDLVIIDHDLGKSNGNGNGVEFIHELRLGENEPAVIVISSDD